MNNKGFTIIELLIAMAFFSFILIVVFSGFIQINRSYNRGVTVRSVQNSARSLTEELTRAIRNSTSVDQIELDPAGQYRLCVGGMRYAWNQNTSGSDFSSEAYQDSGEVFNVVKTDDGANCTAPVLQERASGIIDSNHRVQFIGIQEIGNTGTYNLTVVVSSDNLDDFAAYGENAACAIQVKSEFCDIAKLETTVSLRN